MNRLILSFDYEIYFDGTNEYQNVLKNTKHILEICRKRNVKLVFFVDIYYLIKLREECLDDIADKVSGQLREIIYSGHEIQYHLHPHWVHAKYSHSDNRWNYDPNEYSFSDLVNRYGKEFAYDCFRKGFECIEEISGVKPIAFRAGGLSIDQSQKELCELMTRYKMKFDSSVMPGLVKTGRHIDIDHREAPLKSSWLINPETGFLKDSAEGFIIELPVMTITKKELDPFRRISTSLKYRLLGKIPSYISDDTSSKTFDLAVEYSSHPISITFDKSSKRDLLLLKFFSNEYFSKRGNVMCILSHTKSFINQSFETFDSFLEWVQSDSGKISIVGFGDIMKIR
jgi:peptidoglycan/xylan/chitin deacetylase (PgdA/CDA1 family)